MSRTRLSLIPRRDQTAAIEVWEEEDGSIVTYQNGNPLVSATINLTGKTTISAAGIEIPLSSYMPPVSRYDRALIFAAPPRQANAVKDFSQHINHAQYVGAITDAEVYDTEAGALSVGQATSKALAFAWGKMLFDIDAGESLLIQACVKTVGATTSSNVLFGNSDATVEGLGMVLYGPTHATNAGRLFLNYKGIGTAAQAIQMQPVTVVGAAVTQDVLPTDTYLNITLHIDGSTKQAFVWVNGKIGSNSPQALNAGSPIPVVKRNFGLGYIPADDGYTSSAAKAARFKSFRMAVLPAGMKFVNPGLLDWQFNNDPRKLFTDADYIGSAA